MRFDAQVMVFDLARPGSPCYSCLFPEEGEFEEVQCSTMGVLAPLTGVVGAMQAMEAIKLLAGVGAPLSARLMVIDAKTSEWRTIKVARDPACTVCGN
jgi:molybdopterin/thiamine biosynthesis adenylyltransferase